jgi:hypothetical protein
LHNKPIGCSASEAYAPGLDKEEEELSELANTLLFYYSCQMQ